ncbi:hypothetical protein N9B72_00595 [Bacteriovoracaceae bacterium]|nr:hypothetical protein [Bacteriovoracaceae bacterium]
MGGLQTGLIRRSKNIHGDFALKYSGGTVEIQAILAWLDTNKIKYYPEFEIEVILKHKSFVTPAIIRGIDFSKGTPKFLRGRDTKGLVLGADLGSKLNAYFESDIKIISPSHLDSMMGNFPRQVSARVSDFFISELIEVDSFQGWTRLSLVQNLVRERVPNYLRFFEGVAIEQIDGLLSTFKDNLQLETWEKKNASLVKALRLETTVMLLLFISMTLLVSVSIISGYLIFFSKVKNDMLSFWILGLPKKNLFKLMRNFIFSIGFGTSLCGIMAGLVFLYLLSSFAPEFMPDVFVERKLPVNITVFGILSSFLIPFIVSVLFASIGLNYFKKENASFLKLIRGGS